MRQLKTSYLDDMKDLKVAKEKCMKLYNQTNNEMELYKKWKDRPVSNWSLVRNQLFMNPEM